MMGVGGIGRVGDDSRAEILADASSVEALVSLFEEISAVEGWQPGGELRAYVGSSVYIGGFSGGILGGGLQLVQPDGAGVLPCHKIWPEFPCEVRADIAHVVILAIKPEFRGRAGLLWPVCVGMWRYCVAEGITEITLEATEPVMQVYCKLGFPLQAVGEIRLHWGEPCLLTKLSIAQVTRAITAKAADSGRYREVVDLAYMVGPGGPLVKADGV